MLFPANDKQYLRRTFGKKHRGLPGRVAAAGDDHRFVATKPPLQRRGGVINARPFELFAALGFEPAIIRASRNQDSFCAKHRTATFRLEASAVFLAVRVILQ